MIFLVGSRLRRSYLLLSVKTLPNLPGVGLFVFCSNLFLPLGKSSIVFLVFLYLHVLYQVILQIFIVFRCLLFCRSQTFTKSKYHILLRLNFMFWVLNITFPALNFIGCTFKTEINIFCYLFRLYFY